MSYRIDYQIPGRKEKTNMRLPILTVLCFLFFLFLVSRYWPDGFALIQSVFLWARNGLAAAALEHFTQILSEGETVKEAFSEFLNILLP